MSSLLLIVASINLATAHETLTEWHSDYAAAIDAGREQGKYLLIWFHHPPATAENNSFAASVLGQSAGTIQRRFVAAKLSLDAKFMQDEKSVVLLDHPAFAEMRRQKGLAIVDLTDRNGPHYGQVVSVYPFSPQPISAEKLSVLLDLPQGTLTQRTLIFAVRAHPESPASAASHLSPLLAREAQSHSGLQARLARSGHHHWESRFHAINARLRGGLVAQEICAESWPGQPLLEAASDCVDSWRQSPGHWDAVSRRHALFGYDIQRGANGVWYATGIFAR